MVDKRRVRGIFLTWILYLFLFSKTYAQSNDDNLNQTPVAPTDDGSSPTSPNDPVAAPLFAPNAPEVPETPEPTQQEEDTPEPTQQEEDTPDPTPFEEETPEPTPFEEDTPEPTPEPTPFEEDTPEPTPFLEDTPEPTPFAEDTPEPTPFAEDTPEPTPFAEDTSEPTPFVDDTPDPTPFEEETPEPTPREAETDNPTSEPTPWPTDLPTREPVSDLVPSPVAGTTDSPTSDLFTRPVASKTFSPTWKSVSSPVVFTTDGPTETQSELSPGGIVTAGPTGQPERTPAPTSNPTSSPINDQTQVPSESPSTSSPIFDLNIDYVDRPEELWVVSLNNFLTTNELDKGNAVAVSPDGVLIYITRNRGRLDVHSAIDGSFRFTFTPPRAEPDFFPLECHSGVVFATLETAETTALYAVIDMPPRTDNLTTSIVVEPTSRIVAIAHPYNELLWISEPLPGIIQGNPVVTKGAFPGRFMFVTHNTNTTSSSQEATGHFSVLDLKANGKVIFSESIVDVNASNLYPYGPLGVSYQPNLTRYDSLFSNTNDIVVWTSSTDMGRGASGNVRGFQLPANLTSLAFDDVKTVQIVEVGWNAVARPIFSEDGQGMFIGVRESVVRGWVVNSTFNKGADWSTSFDSEASDSLQPIQNAPIVGRSDELLFISGVNRTLAALNTMTGALVWEATASASIVSEPKVSPDNRRLYSISETGVVECRDVEDGTQYWYFVCNASTGDRCVPSVLAEFDLSPDGTTLYYGDIVGNIRALQLGTPIGRSPPLTDYPSEAPLPTMSESPTVVGYTRPPAAPVGLPSIEPLRSAAPITPPTSGSSSLSTVIVIVTAVLVLTLVTLQ